MTEAQWLAANDPVPMLATLQAGRKISERKLRLFACGCCRRLPPLAEGPAAGMLVALERCVEGQAGPSEVAAIVQDAEEAVERLAWENEAENNDAEAALTALWHLAWACRDIAGAAYERGRVAAYNAVLAAAAAAGPSGEPAWIKARDDEQAAQATLVRDIFGTLAYREVRMDLRWLAWNAGTLKRLAAAAYGERALPSGELEKSRLAVLADALEEAGCHDQEILRHLREQGGVHVRGCWAVDRVLGKGHGCGAAPGTVPPT